MKRKREIEKERDKKRKSNFYSKLYLATTCGKIKCQNKKLYVKIINYDCKEL